MTPANSDTHVEGNGAAPLTPSAEWRRGWPLVLLSVLGLAVVNLMFYSLGVLMAPIHQDTGWTRAEITAGLPVAAFVSLAVLPIVGKLSDRFGVRRLVAPGLAMFGLAIMAVSVLSVSYWAFVGAWLLAQTCSALLSITVWFAAIARIFDRQRGLAMAIAMCGSGLGTAFVPLITSWVVTYFDWRHTYLVLGAGVFCLLPPLLLAFRWMPSLDERGASDGTKQQESGIPLALLLRSRHFFSLAFVCFTMIATLAAMAVHFVPMLTAKGLSVREAAAIAGLIGLSSMIGRLATGAAMDRSSGPIIGVLCFAVPILTSILLLIDGGSVWMASAGAVSLGFASGAEMNMIGYVAGRYFGTQGFGSVFSLLAVAMSIGFGVGPWAASYSVDVTGSYNLLLIYVIPLSALAGLVLATLGPWRLVIPMGEPVAPSLVQALSK
jgi:MFS family permease